MGDYDPDEILFIVQEKWSIPSLWVRSNKFWK